MINSYEGVNEASRRPEEEQNHEDERTVTPLQLREKFNEEDNLTPSQIKLADKISVVREWMRGYSKFDACNVVRDKLDKLSRNTDHNPDHGTTGVLAMASVLAG